ncbi:MAG: ABC transporter permease [Tabrizicola sp.]|uniref:ABC transporter permease n=1 Tax=Tabrizicola sp. TaxID=2005166 RepID=UPI002735CE2F|nr:ABC transporter permease [Tabrizicola sp.]MDP3262906.1 ABC transporter permease [Tabrizicola sp.]MDP3649103.1 ABC transporter permease [Paracoccaceae bacterium]MDZ4065670.1 ABC transporter permease [Tabrizicola sp.]
MKRLIEANAWTVGLAALLALLLIVTKLIQPEFGASGLDSLARAALPFVLATVGMAVVVIAGGIDLSIAAMMAVASVTAARLMEGATDPQSVLVLITVLVLGLAMGAINGALIVVTRVPDIVVTLAMLFVWQGVALLILNAPGGATAPWLRNLIVGGVTLPGFPPGLPPSLTDWIPKAVVVMAIVVTAVWLPIKRSKLGLMFYAIGSDPLAAFRSGVPVGLTRVAAYAVCGLFAALGGLAVTMSTGIGEPIPGPYLLASVAAVVLGGVVLGGGRGGLLGPILAVFVLRLVRMDLTLMSVDPNVAAIVEGTIMVLVVMFGGLLALRGARLDRTG